MRQPGQQQPVFAAGRLALGAIGDDRLASGPGGDRADLVPGGKAGAAAPGQPRRFDDVDEPLGPAAAGPATGSARRPGPARQRPVPALVLPQSGRIGDAREQAGGGHWAGPGRAAVITRQAAVPSTARTQAMLSTSTHVAPLSVPMPRP